MMRFAGVWISRERAMTLTMNSEGRVLTGQHLVFKDHRPKRDRGEFALDEEYPGTRRTGAHPGSPKDLYYKKVIASLLLSDRIAIFGPDSSRFDLDLVLRKRGAIYEKVVAVETAGPMEQEEFEDHVRRFYSLRIPGRRHPSAMHGQEESMTAGA